MSSARPHLPVARIHTIMKSSSDAVVISKESSVMMARAAELFIRKLAVEGLRAGGAKRLEYKNLADVVNTDDKYKFVRDIMPRKITVSEYRRLMKEKHGPNKGKAPDGDGP